ncbi:Bug family tripartite tricarboxylate transporter substrate binding protein [Pseudochelatococcus sp. B33]
MTLKSALCTVAVALLGLAPAVAQAQTPEEFYRGKTVNLYIGYSVGGGYDTYARLVASYIGKHIPGNPTVVPVNMPGAGSLKLTNWLYRAAPKDGTAFGAVARGAPFEPLLKNNAASFDATELNYIGNANTEISLCGFNTAAGIKSIEDLKTKEITVGGTGAGSDPNVQALVLNEIAGTNLKIIDGYPGGNEITLAMERGEIDGRCGWSWSTLKLSSLDWLRDNVVVLPVQYTQTPIEDLKDVPLAQDLASDDLGRGLAGFINATMDLGRPFVAPPDIPADRLEALRNAFMATMSDPEFLAAAKASGLDIVPSDGAALAETVKAVYGSDPAIIEKMISIIRH